MNKSELQKIRLPDKPGVYMFRGAKRELLYIGKATSLRDRVRSYFNTDLLEARGPRLVKVIKDAKSVTWEETDSVLEALILEANLIKKHQPIGNVRDRDNKSYNYVIITSEGYPRVLLVRGRDLKRNASRIPVKNLFGPFPHGGQLKEALKIIRKIFPYFDTKMPIGEAHKAGRLSFNQEIGIYPGKSGELPEKKEYAQVIRHIILFFNGKKRKLLAELEKEMKKLAKAEKFEEAQEAKRQLFALTHINDVTLIKDDYKVPGGKSRIFRIEAFDIAHTSGVEVVGVMTVVEDGEGKTSDYRKFKLKEEGNNDTKALREVLLRRLGHPEWGMPRLIVVDGGKSQVNIAKRTLYEHGYDIPIVGVVKNERHRPKGFEGEKGLAKEHERAILLANSEAHRFALSYHQKRRGKLS